MYYGTKNPMQTQKEISKNRAPQNTPVGLKIKSKKSGSLKVKYFESSDNGYLEPLATRSKSSMAKATTSTTLVPTTTLIEPFQFEQGGKESNLNKSEHEDKESDNDMSDFKAEKSRNTFDNLNPKAPNATAINHPQRCADSSDGVYQTLETSKLMGFP